MTKMNRTKTEMSHGDISAGRAGNKHACVRYLRLCLKSQPKNVTRSFLDHLKGKIAIVGTRRATVFGTRKAHPRDDPDYSSNPYSSTRGSSTAVQFHTTPTSNILVAVNRACARHNRGEGGDQGTVEIHRPFGRHVALQKHKRLPKPPNTKYSTHTSP